MYRVNVKGALRLAVYYARIGRDTGNKEMMAGTRAFIREYWESRHTNTRRFNYGRVDSVCIG